MKELRARLIAFEHRLQFPFGGVSDTNEIVFLGRHTLLEGYIERTFADTPLGEGESQLHIPACTPFLEIHFDTGEKGVWDGKTRKLVKRIRKGSEDLLDLTEQLDTRKKLQGIDLIVGTTSLDMARVAVNRFGFHYGNPTVVENRRRSLKCKDSEVTVFITKAELQAQAPRILTTRDRMAAIEQRRRKKK